MRNSRAIGLAVIWLLGAAGGVEGQVDSAARRLDGSTVRRFDGLAVGPFGGSASGLPSSVDQRTVEPPSRRTVLPPSRRAAELRWYHLGAGLGVIALSTVLDEPIRDELQASRTPGEDDVAAVFRQMGEPEIYGTIGLGTIAVGLLAGDDEVARAGKRISAGLLVAGVSTNVLKWIVGRSRPSFSQSAYRFELLSGRQSWPSGHTTMAFALATGVSDEVRSTAVSVGLYAAAALTAWSRQNDNKHWLSDNLGGAALGVLSAKLMNGRWRILGISGPRFLLGPEQVGVTVRW